MSETTGRVAVTPLGLILSIVYGAGAAYVFCFSGAFGSFGEYWWRDVALVVVTITAAFALTYASMLLIAHLQRSSAEEGDPTSLEWHFLIPCRDEEAVVAETVSAARTSFPNAHVWVIDDASEDATATIVRNLMDVDDHVHLLSRVKPNARTGKGDALNDAYRRVSHWVGDDLDRRERTVIGVLDADGFLSENALALLAGPQAFGNSGIGAAQLEVWMKNRGDRQPRPRAGGYLNALGRYLVRMQDMEFRTSNSAMQLLRVQTRTVGMGGNGQFTRLSVLDSVALRNREPWGNKLSEDFELGLNILTLGFRNAYLRDAHVSQEALPYFRRLITQRTRWSQGVLECATNLPALLRSRSLGVAGVLEIHYFMAQPWLMMLNLLLIPLLTVMAIIDGSFGFLGTAVGWLVLTAGMLFLVLPYAVWGPIYRHRSGEPISAGASIGLGFGYLLYVYFTYIYHPRAIYRMATGQNSWAKTKRNAEGVVEVAPTTAAILVGLPLVDASVLEELTLDLEGADDEVQEIVANFTLIWPRRIANLRLAVAAETPQPVADAIASIRVSAEMMGAARLGNAAVRFTELVAAGDYDACRRALPQLTRVGEDTVAEMRQRFLGLPTRGRH